MTYASLWSWFWCVCGAFAVALSALVWTPAEVLWLFVAASLCAAVLLQVCSATGPGPAGSRATRLLRRSLLVGAGTVAVGSLVSVLPYLALPVVLAAVVTSPAVVRRWLLTEPDTAPLDRIPPDDQIPTGRPLALQETPQDLRGLSDAELCRRWRRSFADLAAAGSPADTARVATLRQACLDELERRCPDALTAWLDSGAPPSGGLEHFLVSARRAAPRSDGA